MPPSKVLSRLHESIRDNDPEQPLLHGRAGADRAAERPGSPAAGRRGPSLPARGSQGRDRRAGRRRPGRCSGRSTSRTHRREHASSGLARASSSSPTACWSRAIEARPADESWPAALLADSNGHSADWIASRLLEAGRSSARAASPATTSRSWSCGGSLTPRPVHVGCSGWSYPDWRERFYPKGLPQSRGSPFYAEHFDTVEINNTFYRLPKRHQRRAVGRAQTPAGFVFTVKVSRYLTHVKRLKAIAALPQAVPRAAGAAGRGGQARPRPVAAAPHPQARRRATGGALELASGLSQRRRVPPPELVRRRGDGAAAGATARRW